ncbi:insecticidal delta-endotoxin [Bacillus paranthracis]|uniref:insecticidal delta-endotoxin n=1 Tax=Bacillus paranthracis TaxID=2026186 RepID=UPI003B00E53A
MKWYEAGLESFKKSSAKDWLLYNRYRREMTLTVLDYVALFSYYDLRQYSIPANVELTRLVHTDPISNIGKLSWYDKAPSFSEIENIVTSYPKNIVLMGVIEIFTSKYKAPVSNVLYMNYWSGHRLRAVSDWDTTKHNFGSTTGDIIDTFALGSSTFQIKSTVGFIENTPMLGGPVYGVHKAIFESISGSTDVYDKGAQANGVILDTASEIPIESSDVLPQSHRLAFISLFGVTSGRVPVYTWAHSSYRAKLSVLAEGITVLPASRSRNANNLTTGPGFTGGYIAKRQGVGEIATYSLLNLRAYDKFRIRIRYAATSDCIVQIKIREAIVGSYNIKKTMNAQDPLTYKSFDYSLHTTVAIPDNFDASKIMELAVINGSGFTSADTLYLDRGEVLRIDSNEEVENTLEQSKKEVYALFTAAKNALKTGVTDYQIDQAANLVECISDDLYAKEKITLLHAVKLAKQLSQVRNLLADPNFNNLNAENSWTASPGVAIIEEDFAYKGRAVQLPSTRDEKFPTYLYQKIDESKLNPYTRYQVRGFVKSSQDLELYLIRYGATDNIMNVPNDIKILDNSSPVNPCEEGESRTAISCGTSNRCKQSIFVDSAAGLGTDQTNEDPHAFSFHIDTGTMDNDGNLGIWVVFKISTSDGYATLGNLELVEMEPLSGESLAQVKRQEQKWAQITTQKREKAAKLYAAAKQVINRLFSDSQGTKLRFDTKFSSILFANQLVYKIQDVYNHWLSAIPGLNYALFIELENRIQNAIALYNTRNAVKNGNFANELTDWLATPNTEVREIEGATVLILSNWNAQVAQSVQVLPNTGYSLRVTAKKEGIGNGYVTILDGVNPIDTLTFNACDSDANTDSSELTGYVTKTLEIFPDTDQILIEIGETEGTFYILF